MSTPLVGDERIAKHFDIHVEGYYDELEPERKAYEKRVRVLAAQWTRDIYEAELQSMRERLRRMEAALRRAQESICYAMEEGVDIGGTAYIDEALSNK